MQNDSRYYPNLNPSSAALYGAEQIAIYFYAKRNAGL
jgi:hypothetical protein